MLTLHRRANRTRRTVITALVSLCLAATIPLASTAHAQSFGSSGSSGAGPIATIVGGVTPPGAGGVDNTAGGYYISDSEHLVIDKVNAYRARHGLPALIPDTGYAKGAREWANHLVSTNSNLHHPSSGDFYENLAYTLHPERAAGLWANSPGHDANMLNTEITHVGVGVVDKGDGLYAVSWRAHSKPSQAHNSVGSPDW